MKGALYPKKAGESTVDKCRVLWHYSVFPNGLGKHLPTTVPNVQGVLRRHERRGKGMTMIRFHLNKEALGEPGQNRDFHGYVPKRTGEDPLAGYKVKVLDGEPYIEWGFDSVSLTTPEQLRPYIARVSAVQHFPSTAKRVVGVYEKGGATGYLNLKTPDEYVLYSTGPSVEALLALYRSIRSGQIRPTESWEGEQIQASPIAAKEASPA